MGAKRTWTNSLISGNESNFTEILILKREGDILFRRRLWTAVLLMHRFSSKSPFEE